MAADLIELTRLIAAFRDARDWSQFHSLRNLIVSLNLEAGELLELTQWKTDEEIAELPAGLHDREALEDECADVLLYLAFAPFAAPFAVARSADSGASPMSSWTRATALFARAARLSVLGTLTSTTAWVPTSSATRSTRRSPARPRPTWQ